MMSEILPSQAQPTLVLGELWYHIELLLDATLSLAIWLIKTSITLPSAW